MNWTMWLALLTSLDRAVRKFKLMMIVSELLSQGLFALLDSLISTRHMVKVVLEVVIFWLKCQFISLKTSG
jgi:hypothetical protein